MFWVKVVDSLDNLSVSDHDIEKEPNVKLLAVALGSQSIDEHPTRFVGKHVQRLDTKGASSELHQPAENAQDLVGKAGAGALRQNIRGGYVLASYRGCPAAVSECQP